MLKDDKLLINKEVSKILGIAESTLRKWCIELEKVGYEFRRGHKESRLFTERDLSVLTHYKELNMKGSYTLQQIAYLVIERFGDIVEESKEVYIRNESGVKEIGIDRMNNLLEEILEINKLIYEELKKKKDPAN